MIEDKRFMIEIEDIIEIKKIVKDEDIKEVII